LDIIGQRVSKPWESSVCFRVNDNVSQLQGRQADKSTVVELQIKLYIKWHSCRCRQEQDKLVDILNYFSLTFAVKIRARIDILLLQLVP